MTITIINGGTQGLGEAIARKLVSQGSTGLVLGVARQIVGRLLPMN